MVFSRMRRFNCAQFDFVLVRMQYVEAGSSVFPNHWFSWREVAVSGLPGWCDVSPPVAAGRKRFAGGFHYNKTVALSSQCRNRFILW